VVDLGEPLAVVREVAALVDSLHGALAAEHHDAARGGVHVQRVLVLYLTASELSLFLEPRQALDAEVQILPHPGELEVPALLWQ